MMKSEQRGRAAGKRPGITGWPAIGALAVCMAAGSGCTALGYRLGSTLPRDIRTIHVATFVNETREPQLEAETTRAVIEELQRDGNLRVVPLGQEDTRLEVRLVDFTQEPLRYDRDRPKTSREFRMRIAAKMILRRRGGEEVLTERQLTGEATFESMGEITTAKRDAIPRASADLAHRIVKAIVEYW